MEKEKKNIKRNGNRIVSYVFLAVVLVLFLGIILRIFTRTILVSRLKMNNAFTDIVFFDSKGLGATESIAEVAVSWETLYPFAVDETVCVDEKEPEKRNLYLEISEKLTNKMSAIQTKINDFTTAYLPGYNVYVYMANKYKKAVGWNFVSYSEYNGIIELNDGYLSTVNEKRNVDKTAGAVIGLNDFCAAKGISFSYVPAPEKICEIEDLEYSGSIDYSNQNLNALIEELESHNVQVLDLRVIMHEQELDHHSLYFRTDHHWTPQTGLWAADIILEYLSNNVMAGKIGTIHREEEFEESVYKSWFLGSQGKKVTLANTNPDDISLLLPGFETSLSIEIPSLGIANSGDFNITYDYAQIEVKDYNKKSPYHAYCYGDRAIIRITNELEADAGKLLIIRDSFGDVVVPFMALSSAEVVAIDPRYFTGSIETLIADEQPDAVILLYGAGEIADPDYTTHNSLWDLR